MSQNGIAERKLTELLPARRNDYYYGKLMDVLHFNMEQQYVLSKQWLYNRTVLGSGVVCGMRVEAISNSSGHGVAIRSGLAIDGWGREIIVPADVAIVPLAITDQCGSPQPAANPLAPGSYMIQVCYNECLTDFSPSLVSDPDCGCGGCEAGTVIESYCLRVLAGTGKAVTIPCLDAVKKGLAAGDVHAVLCELSASCPPDPDDACLTLANVTVAADGTLTVDDCTPRQIAATNLALIQLVSCLADCCSGSTTPPPPKPLQVTGVRVLTTRENAKPDDPNLPQVGNGVLVPPSTNILVKAAELPDVIEITLGSPPPDLDPASVKLSTAKLQGSVTMLPMRPRDQIVPMPGNVFRIYRPSKFQGATQVTLAGGPEGNVPSPTPAIQAKDGTRLDGENPTAGGPGWHSGERTQGGDFKFELNAD